jgi:hypothetical protein
MAGHTCKHVRRSLDAVDIDQGDRKARVLAANAVEGGYSHSKSTAHHAVTAYHGTGPGLGPETGFEEIAPRAAVGITTSPPSGLLTARRPIA